MISPDILTFIASETIPAGARVKLVSGSGIRVQLADASEVEIGTAILHSGKSSYAAETEVGVKLISSPGTRSVIADAGDITAGEPIYRADDGKVGDTGVNFFGYALEASGAAGDVIEAISLPAPASGTPVVVALTSTNGTMAAAADDAAVKVEGEKIGDDVRAIHAALVSKGIISAS